MGQRLKSAVEVIGACWTSAADDVHSQQLPRSLQFVPTAAVPWDRSSWQDPIVTALGTISRASSICLAGNPATYGVIPVTLPPAALYSRSGPDARSASAGGTIGIVEVACFAANADAGGGEDQVGIS